MDGPAGPDSTFCTDPVTEKVEPRGTAGAGGFVVIPIGTRLAGTGRTWMALVTTSSPAFSDQART